LSLCTLDGGTRSGEGPGRTEQINPHG
jgi:hypothetical protein